MADTPWETLYEELETATAEYERGELVGLLRDLIREYVIERGLPTGAPTATTPDLSSLDFPRLITWLKRNLAVPELGLFEVDGDRVIVQADGPRVLGATPTEMPPPPPPTRREAERPPATRPARPAALRPGTAEQRPQSATRRAQAEAEKAAEKLSPGFRGLEFD